MEPSSHFNTGFIAPTSKHALVIWWALLWRGVTLGGGISFVIGFLEGLIGAIVHVGPKTILYLNILTGMIVGIPVGIYVVKFVLTKKFKGFSIRLVRNN